ncbi:MAG: pyruvate formate lyase family protein [Lachnospira eligens]
MLSVLLYAINGGVDDKTKVQVGPKYRPITSEYLDYDEVMERYDRDDGMVSRMFMLMLLTSFIICMINTTYERLLRWHLLMQMLRDSSQQVLQDFHVVVDSLSAIKYAKVKAIREILKTVLLLHYETEGDFPKYGNDDDRADDIAVWLLKSFLDKIKKRHTYRNSEPTTSILTITSNVVYGKFTGNMPDGRKAGTPLAPGANPSYGAEQNGLLASLNSLTKLPYEWALDGISNTQTMNPDALGHDDSERVNNLVQRNGRILRSGCSSP